VIFAWMVGNTTTYTYIAPFLNEAGSGIAIARLLVVFGIASIAGIALTAALVLLKGP
jgi:predicted MFS family arabinose efflux permease